MKITLLLGISFLFYPSIVAMDQQQLANCHSCEAHFSSALIALEEKKFNLVIEQISLAEPKMAGLSQGCRIHAQSKADFINGSLLQEANQKEAAKKYFNQVLSNKSAPQDIRTKTLTRLAQIQMQH